ncbi:Nucleolar complex protein 2 homolog [Geodia barretti]|uniref:Nucleolar complex protein 2 homolog n=1 Tax=Geodia barretti TaxID=519541 RepID=A0AA35WG96_GEOBA|nr:Nucleolar complex protein 2 homolog [Geodia barretti]
MPKRRSRGGRGEWGVREVEKGAGNVKGSKKMKLSESLAGLATSDPEFYQYLRDNDHELLEFRDSEEEEVEREEEEESGDEEPGEGGGGGGGGEVEEVPLNISSWKQTKVEEDSSGEDEKEEKEKEEGEGGGIPVTAAMVKNWVSAITEEHSLAGVKQLSLALRAAVRGVRGGEEGGEVYHVSGTSEFNAVVLACLTHVTPCLNHHIPPLPSSNTPKKRPFRPSSHKIWGRVRPVAESHCLVVLELVRGLKEPSMVCAVLR